MRLVLTRLLGLEFKVSGSLFPEESQEEPSKAASLLAAGHSLAQGLGPHPNTPGSRGSALTLMAGEAGNGSEGG